MNIVYKYAYRKLKKDIKEFPPPEVVRQNIYVTLEPRARKLYDKMAKESIVQLEGKFSTGNPCEQGQAHSTSRLHQRQ